MGVELRNPAVLEVSGVAKAFVKPAGNRGFSGTRGSIDRHDPSESLLAARLGCRGCTQSGVQWCSSRGAELLEVTLS